MQRWCAKILSWCHRCNKRQDFRTSPLAPNQHLPRPPRPYDNVPPQQPPFHLRHNLILVSLLDCLIRVTMITTFTTTIILINTTIITTTTIIIIIITIVIITIIITTIIITITITTTTTTTTTTPTTTHYYRPGPGGKRKRMLPGWRSPWMKLSLKSIFRKKSMQSLPRLSCTVGSLAERMLPWLANFGKA